MRPGPARDNLTQAIVEQCRSGLAPADLRERVLPRLRRAVEPMLRRQAEAEALQQKVEALQERLLELQERAEAIQERRGRRA